MRATLGIFVLLMTVSSSIGHAQTPAHVWSMGFGSTLGDFGRAVVLDDAGNTYMVASFAGLVDFGDGALSAQGTDFVIAKYDANGLCLWSRRVGNMGNDVATAVAITPSGVIAVAGFFEGAVDFGFGFTPSAGQTDAFLMFVDTDGFSLGSVTTGGPTHDAALGVAVDAANGFVLTGRFTGTANWGLGAHVSAGGDDAFLTRYNASGVPQWSRRFGSTGNDVGNAVAMDDAGNATVTGNFTGTVDFGGGGLASNGGLDAFVVQHDVAGSHLWSRALGGTGGDAGNSVAVDASGDVIVTGHFTGSVDFGGGVIPGAGLTDVFLARYDTGGAHVWSKGFGDAGTAVGSDVTVDAGGNIVLTGSFNDTMDFGGTTLTSLGQDVFLASYDGNGSPRWSQRFGGASTDAGNGVAVDDSGNVVATGSYGSAADFGGGNLPFGGISDVFLAKFGFYPAEPVILSIVDIANDQGRKVKIRFGRSHYDANGSSTPITEYVAFRRDDPAPSPAFVHRERGLLADGWTEVGSVHAFTDDSYGIDVPTIGDSTIVVGDYYSTFFIRAATAAAGTFYDSPVDSGYSVDNLAPGVPANFVYVAGALSWDESGAADFDYFTVYGSNTNSFGAATLVDYTSGTGLDVTAAGYAFYFVTATDFSGNEGQPAAINSLTGVGGTPNRHVLSISSYPNPFNPETTVRYTLPARGRVTIVVYDLRGAHVATLLDADKDAGAYTIGWNGRDDRGSAVGSGVYFARLTSPAGTRSYKMTLLK